MPVDTYGASFTGLMTTEKVSVSTAELSSVAEIIIINDPDESEVSANFSQWSDYVPTDVGMNVGGGEGYELPYEE